jgi:hypothetical protein
MDDCVIEFSNSQLLIQIKSRKKGTFSKKEIQKIIASMDLKAKALGGKININVVLEQPCPATKPKMLD